MHEYSVEIDFSDAVRLDEAATDMGCTVKSLLREAAMDERVLYVALEPHAATLTAIPSHDSPRTGSYETREPKYVSLLGRYAKMLAIKDSVVVESWPASHDGGVLDWHFWRLDLPQTVTLDRIFVPRSDVDMSLMRNLDPEHLPLTETERNKLLKHIGGLALALAEKSNLYKRGEAPNGLGIATAVSEILGAIPDANASGAGIASLRASIKEGLDLLKK
jgi:hypothetical protein